MSNTADLMERLDALKIEVDALNADKKSPSIEETEQNASPDIKKRVKSKKDMWSRNLLEK